MRTNRTAQVREPSRLLDLCEGKAGLEGVTEREIASALLGRLAAVGGAGETPVAHRPRVEPEGSLEARQRGPARLAQRSEALVRRERRRGFRPTARTETPSGLLGLAPDLAVPAGLRASDLLALCRAFGEVLERLEEFARALAEAEPAAMASTPPTTTAPADGAEVGHPDGLTEREVEVLCLVAEGRTSKEIAAELCVAVPTVSRHLANIYAKIDARSRADATRYAVTRLAGALAARQQARLG